MPLAIVVVLMPLAACAGHKPPATLPPLVIDAPGTVPFAGTTLTLRAEQSRRMSPVQWSVTSDERAWVSTDGTLTFLEPGDVAVHATDGWRAGSRDFAVRANPAVQVVMQQRVVTNASVGDTVRIKGHVFGESGAVVDDAPVAYALAARGDVPPAATVTADGRFVAREPGIYTVIAECGRVSGRTIVIVEGPEERAARSLLALRGLRTAELSAPVAGVPPRLHDATPTADMRHPADAPASDSPRRAMAAVRVAAVRTTRVAIDDFEAAPYDGTTLSLTAHVWVGEAREPDSTAQVAWISSDPERAWVTQSGRVAFLAPGWVTITATHGGVVATRRFNVRWLPAVRLALRPSTADVHVGQAVRFREDVWQPGTIPVADARVNYAIIAYGADGLVPATISERRVFMATQPGVYTVIAEVGGVADKFTVLVRDATVAAR